MHKICKRFLASAVLACFPLVFSACGGGNSAAIEMTTISGTTIKGPIKGALVQVFKLKSDGTRGELLGSSTSDSNASYAIPVPKTKAIAPLLVVVTGMAGSTYLSESTGIDVAFTPSESFSAAIDTFDTAKKYTVSPLTDAAYQQVQKFLTDSPSATADSRIISAANARIATLFNVNDILADPASDPAYTASLKIIDQMIVDSKVSGATNTLQTTNLINQGFVDVTTKPYQNYQTALITAAATVAAKDPAVIPVINAIVATAAAPPTEPVWTDITAPDAIKFLKAVPGADTATTDSVALSWSVATTSGRNPVAGYDIYRDGMKVSSVTSIGYVDKPLAQSTAHTYYVVAFDAAGNRAQPSPEETVTTPAAPNLNITIGGQLDSGLTSLPFMDITAPTAPSNLAASATAVTATTSSIKLIWSGATDNVAITGYEVYRDGKKIGTTPLTSYNDPSVTSGVASSYTVIAFDVAGNRSAAGGALSVTPTAPNVVITVGGQLSSDTTALPFKDITPPSAPANLVASTTAINAVTDSVSLAWSASTDDVAVAGYDVYRNASKIGTVSLNTFADPSVTPGTAYSYTVIAFDAAGNRSVASSPLTVTPVAPNLGITVGGQLSP